MPNFLKLGFLRIFLAAAVATTFSLTANAENNPSDSQVAEDHIFAARELLDSGEINSALSLAQSLYNPQNKAPAVAILLGRIYEHKQDYEKALKYLLEADVELGGDEVVDAAIAHESAKSAFNRMRLDMLRSLANVNLQLLRCEEAEKDTIKLAELQGMENSSEAFGSSMKGLCLQNNKDYAAAAESFEEAYKNFSQNQLKEEAAYNVASMYAKMGNEKKSADWLGISLKGEAVIWREKVKDDENFKEVLATDNFKELLSEN